MQYIRLSEGKTKYKLIPAEEDIWKHIDSNEKEYFVSVYKYNQTHYDQWKKTNTISGIKDVVTDKLIFDFDSKKDIEAARQDTITTVSRLITKGVPAEAIQIAFSGQKGFSIEVLTNSEFKVDEFKNITGQVAGDLDTFDKVVSDPQRIFRVPLTKHSQSGLYKFPLSFNQLCELPIDEIRRQASDLNNVDETLIDMYKRVSIPEGLLKLKESTVKKEVAPIITKELDLSLKPRWLSPAKYALQEGYFQDGERSNAFMILASTYKNQGFNRDVVYRMLKGVAQVQAERNNMERFPDKELWNNVVETVFGPNWKGGQYGPDHPLLLKICQQFGFENEKEESFLLKVNNVSDVFRNFAENIDKNTMKLGIEQIDKNVRVTTSMLVGLLGAPSSGKTTCAINFLNYASSNNINSIFFSLDMGAPLVFQRFIQRHHGLTSNDLFKIYKDKEVKRIKEIEQTVEKNYKNVDFCFRSGICPDDVRQSIIKRQEETGQKIKLCVIDYLECLNEKYSDPTANTALIAQKLKDIANDLDITIVLLLQPQKHAGDPSDELLSYRSVKGSSAIEQACSIIFSVWRPGFSPSRPHDDKYLSVAVLKNRMGGLNQFDFRWNGLTGMISNLEDDDKDILSDLREMKRQEKLNKDTGF